MRVSTIEAAGVERVPFTSGILVGIGEHTDEIVDSLFELARIQAEYGHLQEIIIQTSEPRLTHP